MDHGMFFISVRLLPDVEGGEERVLAGYHAPAAPDERDEVLLRGPVFGPDAGEARFLVAARRWEVSTVAGRMHAALASCVLLVVPKR